MVRLLFWLIGAAIGAAAQGVSWTFWAAWALAVGSLCVVGTWHRGKNGSHASA